VLNSIVGIKSNYGLIESDYDRSCFSSELLVHFLKCLKILDYEGGWQIGVMVVSQKSRTRKATAIRKRYCDTTSSLSC
jgi:hypothetical protein